MTRSETSGEPLHPDDLVVQLTKQYWDRLRFFAVRHLRDVSMAEDVAQETLRRALEALRAGRVENRNALPAFLFQTARHVCMQKARSAGRESRAYQRLGHAPDEEAETVEDPLAGLISSERRIRVRRALASLEPSDRDLLQMIYSEGAGTEEIARRLNLTPGAVRVRRHRAVARLAKILDVTKSVDREQL